MTTVIGNPTFVVANDDVFFTSEAGFTANVLTNDISTGDSPPVVINGGSNFIEPDTPSFVPGGTVTLSRLGVLVYDTSTLGPLAAGEVIDFAFEYVVSASGAANTDIGVVTIFVTGENDPPRFTSPITATAAENQTFAIDLDAVDDEEPLRPLAFSITGGEDADLFTIDKNTGVLSFVDAPDFEDPDDEGGDNIYIVDVTVSDGGGAGGPVGTVTETITITVTDEPDDAPEVTLIEFAAPSEAVVIEEGLTVLSNFDTRFLFERSSDTALVDVAGDTVALNSTFDLYRLTRRLERDGDDATGAFVAGDDLIFVFDRDEEGQPIDGIALTDVVGQDGVARFFLRLLGADEAGPEEDVFFETPTRVLAADDLALT